MIQQLIDLVMTSGSLWLSLATIIAALWLVLFLSSLLTALFTGG